MQFETVMQELEALGKERLKKLYISNGAQEPLFGVATGEMKPIFKKTKINQPMAERLYATGNYDAMYFAGIIAGCWGIDRIANSPKIKFPRCLIGWSVQFMILPNEPNTQ